MEYDKSSVASGSKFSYVKLLGLASRGEIDEAKKILDRAGNDETIKRWAEANIESKDPNFRMLAQFIFEKVDLSVEES